MSATLDGAIHALMQRVSEQVILPRYQSLASGEVVAKGPGDVVTVADHEAEAILSEALAALDPGLAIVGEEATHADPAVQDALGRDCWIIDPLDGTRNFAAGKPPFGIILARASGGICTSGWVYDCLTGRFCAAHAGQGAWLDGERVAARPTGLATPVAAISLIYMDPAHREAVKAQVAPHYSLVDIPYCAAEQYPRLGLGVNDVSIFERTLAWDHAAGVLWLNEAGGKAARPDGSAYRADEWDRRGLIGAASPALWEELAVRMAALA
ncbi:inositol monophosphatase family protein [Altererythrobacter sp. H2]|uniref:inositol monophosphatase family protein n=1 Tax=Altererythrobacter sp. H2 TaxID=3108391 RepID=UPI002B4C1D71|nr:inositol monophosphatase family protein [Altererythrobacter sp. H2]WRK94924.1 inositol monophosphatase family protein [Altererythrobacter sp. H2]